MTVLPGSRFQFAPRRGGVAGTLLLALLVIAAILPRIGFLARPFESDSGLYIYMGKALWNGQTLYQDFYETKPPGVALLTAGLFGVFGHHWWPYVLLQTAMAVTSALLLRNAARKTINEHAGLATFLFALVFLNFSHTVYRGFQLETIQIFFACLAAHFGLKLSSYGLKNVFLSGLFAGAAAMIKPTAAAVAGGLVLTILISRRHRFRALAVMILGVAILPLAVFVWTWRAGLLPFMPDLFKEISLYAGQTPIVPEDLFKPLCVIVIGGFAFAVASIFRRRAILDSSDCDRPAAPLIVFASTWLILECLGVFMQRRMYTYHFLPLAPPLALLFGGACRTGRPIGVQVLAFTPILVLSLAPMRSELIDVLHGAPHNLPQSDYLLAHAAPGDSVVGDPAERMLMETHLPCGSRYAHLFYFGNHDDAPLIHGQRFLEDLKKNQPRWAIFETNRVARHQRQLHDLTIYAQRPLRKQHFLQIWQEIDNYLAAHYTPVGQFNDMTIYQRNTGFQSVRMTPK